MATTLEPMGIFRRFFHNVLGWHEPTEWSGFDGCSALGVCRYCDKQIMQDSQGNWFPHTVANDKLWGDKARG